MQRVYPHLQTKQLEAYLEWASQGNGMYHLKCHTPKAERTSRLDCSHIQKHTKCLLISSSSQIVSCKTGKLVADMENIFSPVDPKWSSCHATHSSVGTPCGPFQRVSQGKCNATSIDLCRWTQASLKFLKRRSPPRSEQGKYIWVL